MRTSKTLMTLNVRNLGLFSPSKYYFFLICYELSYLLILLEYFNTTLEEY